jgi:hypothetical protein
MLICTNANCGRIYGDSAVVNTKSNASNFAAKEWTDPQQRCQNYMFLYGPDEPPYFSQKLSCSPTWSSSPSWKGRTCTLVDLAVYVPSQPPPQMPVQTVTLPTPVIPVVTHVSPVHIKPTWSFPSSVPAISNGIAYADGECQLCKKSNQHTIRESARTRWAAEKIHAYLGVLAVTSNPGFMVGVVIHEKERVIGVAYSTNSATDNALKNLEGCKFEHYKLKLYGNFGFADISKSRGGKDISKFENLSYVTVGTTGSRSSSTCAASKLAKRYLTTGKLSEWNMTEIAYGTMHGYTDGEPAESCIGCKSFLPTLLCYQSD